MRVYRGYTMVFRRGLTPKTHTEAGAPIPKKWQYSQGWQVKEWDWMSVGERPTFSTSVEMQRYIDDEIAAENYETE
jgi:hypothetical protein